MTHYRGNEATNQQSYNSLSKLPAARRRSGPVGRIYYESIMKHYESTRQHYESIMEALRNTIKYRDSDTSHDESIMTAPSSITKVL